MKLNLEIDERNKSISTSESPLKKSGPNRGRVSKARGSRPQSRSRSIELNFINKDEEKFCWSQMSNQNPNNYIWAPMSQEELDQNNQKDGRVVEGVPLICNLFEAMCSKLRLGIICFFLLISDQIFTKLSGQIAHFREFSGARDLFPLKSNTLRNILS